MTNWVLVISRDSELTAALGRVLFRNGSDCHLWAVEGTELARR